MGRAVYIAIAFALGLASPVIAAGPTPAAIDAEVSKAMSATGAKGLAIAVIENGKVTYTQAYGIRNEKGDPLQTDTIMYGASLTKAVFVYSVMQLVDQGKIDLDRPIATYLREPLPDYPPEDKYAIGRP